MFFQEYTFTEILLARSVCFENFAPVWSAWKVGIEARGQTTSYRHAGTTLAKDITWRHNGSEWVKVEKETQLPGSLPPDPHRAIAPWPHQGAYMASWTPGIIFRENHTLVTISAWPLHLHKLFWKKKNQLIVLNENGYDQNDLQMCEMVVVEVAFSLLWDWGYSSEFECQTRDRKCLYSVKCADTSRHTVPWSSSAGRQGH